VRGPLRVLRTGTGTEVVDYAAPSRAAVASRTAEPVAQTEAPIDYLDIPAFLRRQAD
jgi:cell division protein FtsZ